MLKKIAIPGLVLAVASAPLGAAYARAEVQRQAAPVNGESRIGGESNLFFFLGIAVVAASIFLLSEDDDPVSP